MYLILADDHSEETRKNFFLYRSKIEPGKDSIVYFKNAKHRYHNCDNNTIKDLLLLEGEYRYKTGGWDEKPISLKTLNFLLS